MLRDKTSLEQEIEVLELKLIEANKYVAIANAEIERDYLNGEEPAFESCAAMGEVIGEMEFLLKDLRSQLASLS